MLYGYLDFLVNASIALIIVMGVSTIYAIIISNKHTIVTFFLVPLLVITSIVSSVTIFTLQGTPIYQEPVNKNIDVISISIAKPWIYMVARDTDYDDAPPKFYAFAYTKERAKELQEINTRKRMGMSTKGQLESVEQTGNEYAPGELRWKPEKGGKYIPKDNDLGSRP